MNAETNLEQMLIGLRPVVIRGGFVPEEFVPEEFVPEEFVIVSSADSDVASLAGRLDVVASVREAEGTTYVLRRSDADEHAIAYDFVAAWITLSVNSALDAVGLTAAVSAALASVGISCNVLAGHRHDHLLVPRDRVADAVAALEELSERARRCVATNAPGSMPSAVGTMGEMGEMGDMGTMGEMGEMGDLGGTGERRGPVVVVPLDGSDVAARALRPAVTLAAELGGSVTAVVAVDSPGEARSSADDRRAVIHERLCRFDSIVPTRIEMHEGSPGAAIASAAASVGTSLVCMATHGRGDLARLVVGSVAEEVIRSVDVPVVLVGDRCRTAPLVGEHGRLVVCHDGSDPASQVLPVAAEFAARQAMSTWIVEVVPPDENVPDPNEPESAPRQHGLAADATERLGAVAERFRDLAVRAGSDAPRPLPEVAVEALHGADVGHAIEHFVERIGATYVAIATHGAGGIARVALGSVAMEVVRRSPCPVIVVRAT